MEYILYSQEPVPLPARSAMMMIAVCIILCVYSQQEQQDATTQRTTIDAYFGSIRCRLMTDGPRKASQVPARRTIVNR